jgi:hypothetical protein
MAPVPLTLLRLPAEIRNRIWRFSLPHSPDLEVDACLTAEAPSTGCKYIDLKRYNWKEEALLVVNHQTRHEIDPWILRQKRVLKFCNDKCLEKFLRETGEDRTTRAGRAKPLDDLKVHLIVGLGPPPHSRMAKAVAKMRVAGEIQKLIARLRPELLSVDLLPIDIIQELCTAEKMHVWAHFVVKARREATKSWLPNNPPGLTPITRVAVHRETEEHLTRLRSRRTLRSTRSSSALALNTHGSFEEGDPDEVSTQHRAALERTRQRRTSPRVDFNRETSMAVRIRALGSPTYVGHGSGGRRHPRLPAIFGHEIRLE